MQLNNNPQPVFADIPNGTDEPAKPAPKPVAKKKPATKPVAKPKRTKMAAGKVNVCYSVDSSVRDDMQSLSFMLRKSQSDIVTEAIKAYVKRQGISLPKRAA